MKKLGKIAEIRTGYPFRGRIERVEGGGCRLVQMGDVRAEVGDRLAHVKAPANWEKHALQNEDVLFVGRGSRNEAATFFGRAGDVIAAPHLFVLRPRADVACGDYLTWFLNLPETQEKVEGMRSGSALPFVPMSALARLEVPVPTIEQQKVVAELYRLGLRERALLEQIGIQRQRLLDGTIRRAIENSDSAREWIDEVLREREL